MDYETIRELAFNELEQEGEFSDSDSFERYTEENELDIVIQYCIDNDIELEE